MIGMGLNSRQGNVSTKSKRSFGCANPPKAQAIQKKHSDAVFEAFKLKMEAKSNG